MSEWVLKTRKWTTRLSLIWITRLVRLFSLLVPYRVGVWAGGVLGFIAYYLLPRERNRALTHLTLAFPEKERSWIRHTARGCFLHLGKCLLEVMLMTPRRLEQVIEFRGEEALRAAIGIGKGVIYVTGHIGNWEIMGHAVAARYNLSVIAAPIEPEQVNDMIVGLRARMGVRTILRSRPGASRELVRVFKENRIMGILIDQDTDVESAFVDFMGLRAWTPTAAASMALKFGAPVIFGYIQRTRDNKHAITVEGPLELVLTGDREKDIITTTAMLTKKIEDTIRRNPEQWVWMHRRWRRQP
ncbi:MAG: lysophospholipid acyltransferase family protein [Nitrospirae bacterium]|nr:lysophospholipid acyltransferase family protein [Nitrospirota bacterium]